MAEEANHAARCPLFESPWGHVEKGLYEEDQHYDH
jgi:hypothetical protein